MKVMGYTDPLSVAVGSRIRFMVSCVTESYEAEIVRLIHGDRNPDGPGLRLERMTTSVNGRYPGREQPIRCGSYVRVGDNRLLRDLKSFSIQCWLYPTTPKGRRQGVVTKWSATRGVGYGLFLHEDGDLSAMIGDGNGPMCEVRTRRSLRPRAWYFAAVSYDADERKLRLTQRPLEGWSPERRGATAESVTPLFPGVTAGIPLLIGASSIDLAGMDVVESFNGKIDRPCLFGRPLEDHELDILQSDASPTDLPGPLVAVWDFSAEPQGSVAKDISGNGLHGEVINMPTRAVTGHNWTGKELCFRLAPNEYGAIHFHDDDLEDAGWESDFELHVPDELQSGVYAAHLRAGDGEDYVPFFVTARPGEPRAPIALLLPTFCYLAYANEHLRPFGTGRTRTDDLPGFFEGATEYEKALYTYIFAGNLLSTYDLHSDGTAVCYSSRLRPIANMRPTCNQCSLNYRIPHNFNPDLYIIDWLESKQFSYDVITDEQLHLDGYRLLSGYKTVLTGTHPEYYTSSMITGLEKYLWEGGRVMYLGGNGFYWVTSVVPGKEHVIEIRRGESGTRISQVAPGEYYHASTGEPGGLWRFRGYPPQRLFGVGLTAVGVDRASGYRRTAESFDEQVAFIFDGVESEVIGDFGLQIGGAAGWEIDRADQRLGTAPHAITLATSFGHSDAYQHVVEEVFETNANEGGRASPLVRADLVYTEYPNGGAVFSVGSMCWCGSLSYNHYENNVSRVTENVIRKFGAP